MALPSALAALAALLPPPWSAATWDPAPRPATAALGAAVLGAATVLTWVLLLWTGLVVGLTVASRGSGRVARIAGRALRRLLPVALRRAVAVSLGLSLVGGYASGATAMARTPSTPSAGTAGAGAAQVAPPSTTAVEVAGLPGSTQVSGTGTVRGVSFPTGPGAGASGQVTLVVIDPRGGVDMPADRSAPPVHDPGDIDVDWPGPTRGSAEPPVVVVHRGDTLWSIAARQLGGHPSNAQIDAAWRAWYQANRLVIGPDPDLILPGQQLHPPTVVQEAHR